MGFRKSVNWSGNWIPLPDFGDKTITKVFSLIRFNHAYDMYVIYHSVAQYICDTKIIEH